MSKEKAIELIQGIIDYNSNTKWGSALRYAVKVLNNNFSEDNEDLDIFDIIEKYNLSIRRIPNKTYKTTNMRHHKEGNEIIFRYGREMSRETIIPKNAGYYMVKEVNDTGSIVGWNIKTDNLSQSLKESVMMFIEKKKNKMN